MSRKRPKKNSKTAIPLTNLADNLHRHIRDDLGMGTVEAYFDWCRAHGFPAHLRKTPQKLGEESRYVREEQLRASLARARSQHRPERVLARILDGDCSDLPPRMQGVCLALHGRHHGDLEFRKQREFGEQLLRHLNTRCKRFLWGRAGSSTVLEAVLTMARYHRHAVRPVADWRPKSKNAERNVAALARHLFARWDVPAFLDSCWFEWSEHQDEARTWFLHIGRGRSVRTAGLPVPFTKKMAHHFLQAPRDSSPAAAVRWGQVHGLGGDPRLCAALRETRLCESFAHDDFWTTVLAFFVRNPMLDVRHVGPIVDYLHHHRFVGERFVDAGGRIHDVPPPQPNLTMRGRTAESLLAQVEAWHRQLGRATTTDSDAAWPPSGIVPFRSEEGQGETKTRTFVIRELCSPAELQAEGRRMNHCVATYAGSCRAGQSSIWTLELHGPEGLKTMATIEVRNKLGRIVQVKAKSNREPSPQARTLIHRWANATGLAIASWV